MMLGGGTNLAKWSNATALKAVLLGGAGSNPAVSFLHSLHSNIILLLHAVTMNLLSSQSDKN
jgi:hypothetical protein